MYTYACVCGLNLVSGLCHYLICGLPPFGLLSPYLQCIKAYRPVGEGAVWRRRKVKIKLLWTNSLFDQVVHWWKAFFSTSQLWEERWINVLFCFISLLSSFILFHTAVYSLPLLLWRVTVWSRERKAKHICAHNDLKAMQTTLVLEYLV